MGLAETIQMKSREHRQNLTIWKDYHALLGDFDFHHKRKPTVPLYAYGLRLLVFGAFLTVCQRVKKFFDTLSGVLTDAAVISVFRGT